VAQKPAAQKPEAAKAPTAPAAPAAEKVSAPAAPAAEKVSAPAAETPAAEKVSAPAAEASSEPKMPMGLGDIFAEMFNAPAGETKAGKNDAPYTPEDFANGVLGAIFGDLAEGKLPEGVEFAPESFVFDLFNSNDDALFCEGPCAEQEDPFEEVFAAGIAEGLNRANHPAYGFGRQKAPAPMAPIQIVDQTTASFGHLVELQKLHVAGILTDAEYEGKKQDILRRIY
jgi:hypothetical protein